MRIERIKCSRLTGLGDVNWTFPLGPVLLFCEHRSHQKTLGRLLEELFYDPKIPSILKAETNMGLLEVWMAGGNTRFQICQNFIQQGNGFVRSSIQVSDLDTGQNVSVPENMTVGDHIFQISLRAFRQGMLVDWPDKNERDHLRLLVNNLRQGGDEGLSLIKVRASLAGARKKVNEQNGKMMIAKAEYAALRGEWDAAHLQQDENMLRLIAIKKLQENEVILADKIASALIIHERLALLTQNSDYRELRKIQGELIQLEEWLIAVELNLTTLTSESVVDWVVIEDLREECLEWASLQEQVERLAVLVRMQTDKIAELKGALQSLGYQGLTEGDDQRLRRAEEERAEAQEELKELTITKINLKSAQQLYSIEIARLQDLADMADVTEAQEVKITQRERYLKQWQNSKTGRSIDRILRKHINGTNIGEKLESRLGKYYKSYQSSNFEEFTRRLKDFRDQKILVERVKLQIERLQEIISKEAILSTIVHSHTEFLKQAFVKAMVENLPAWLIGWEEYQNKNHQLAIEINELQRLLEQSSRYEKKLHVCADQLRVKLGNWDTPVTDRDEVLSALFKVASQLRMKDETEREIAEYSQRFNDMLGDRKIEYLTKKLEPLAELERETRVSDDERLAELTAWQNKLLETRRQRREVTQRVECSRKFPSLTVLEKKIETLKQQWMAHEDLNRAIHDAQVLLEMSWEEWQAKFGAALNSEMKWILSKIPSSLAQEGMHKSLADAKRDYFAYRMAIVQLTLGSYTEVPLIFSVAEIDEDDRFWVHVIEYFRKLSLTRQIILITTDPKLAKKLTGIGWPSVNMGL